MARGYSIVACGILTSPTHPKALTRWPRPRPVGLAERLAFAEVTGGTAGLTAPMEESYAAFGLEASETTTLESYIREYYDTILKRLRDMEADLDKDAKKKLPF